MYSTGTGGGSRPGTRARASRPRPPSGSSPRARPARPSTCSCSIANPGGTAAQVEAATTCSPDGTVMVKPTRVRPNSRFNIWVDFEDPRLADTAVSTHDTLDQRRADDRGARDVVARQRLVRGAQLAGVDDDGDALGDWQKGEVGGPTARDVHPGRQHLGVAGAGHRDPAVRGRDQPRSSTILVNRAAASTWPVGFEFSDAVATQRFGAVVESLRRRGDGATRRRARDVLGRPGGLGLERRHQRAGDEAAVTGGRAGLTASAKASARPPVLRRRRSPRPTGGHLG